MGLNILQDHVNDRGDKQSYPKGEYFHMDGSKIYSRLFGNHVEMNGFGTQLKGDGPAWVQDRAKDGRRFVHVEYMLKSTMRKQVILGICRASLQVHFVTKTNVDILLQTA